MGGSIVFESSRPAERIPCDDPRAKCGRRCGWAHFVPGEVAFYRVNGKSVSRAEFDAAVAAEQARARPPRA